MNAQLNKPKGWSRTTCNNKQRFYTDEQLQSMTLQQLIDAGIVSYTKIRNNTIRREFYELSQTGMTISVIIQQLADKHYLSYDSINGIIYRTNRP